MTINGLASITAATDRSGLVLVAKTDFSAAASFAVNNCFTSEYTNYKVLFNWSPPSATGFVRMRLRASGVDNSTANYVGAETTSTSSAGPNRTTYSAQTLWNVSYLEASITYAFTEMDFFNPAAALPTIASYHDGGMYGSSTYGGSVGMRGHNVSSAFDGFAVFPASGTITGSVRVYGYRNNV